MTESERRPHVHELLPLGTLPDTGRQWFGLDAVPEAHQGYIGECLVLTMPDVAVRSAKRLPNGVLEHDPLPPGIEVKYWCLPPLDRPTGR